MITKMLSPDEPTMMGHLVGEVPKLNLIDLSEQNDTVLAHSTLLVGESGSGKTRMLGTLPKPFICDFDMGLMTLKGQPVKAKYYPDSGWDAFKKEVELWRSKGPQYGCESFCVDTLSSAGEAALTYVLTKNGRVNGQAQIGDWGEAQREIKDVLNKIVVLPKLWSVNVAATAHLLTERDDLLGGITYLTHIITSKLPPRVPGWFDNVWLMVPVTTLIDGKPKTEYRVQIKPDMKIKMMKSRLDRNGTKLNLFETPDFPTILKKLN